MIGTLLAYATGWLATKWLSWIPAAIGWVWWLISTTIKGTFSFAQDPKELTAVIVLLITAFGIGAWAMFGFVGYRVKTVEAQMAALWQDMSKKDREDARKAAEAKAARAAAEAAERQRQINEANTRKLPPLATVVPPAPAVSSSPVVRKGHNPVRARKCEQGLFGCL